MCKGEKNVSLEHFVFAICRTNVTPKKFIGGFLSCFWLCSKVFDAEYCKNLHSERNESLVDSTFNCQNGARKITFPGGKPSPSFVWPLWKTIV